MLLLLILLYNIAPKPNTLLHDVLNRLKWIQQFDFIHLYTKCDNFLSLSLSLSLSQDNKTYCPTSGNPLKVKDLIAVKFTPIADRDTKTATIVKQVRERIGGSGRERGREREE